MGGLGSRDRPLGFASPHRPGPCSPKARKRHGCGDVLPRRHRPSGRGRVRVHFLLFIGFGAVLAAALLA
eukprot:1710972-Alexandrium_andersonii.AAC.1